MKKHSLLSASGSSRWLNCTPSAMLESKYVSKASSFADEGTHAHAIAELLTKWYLGMITKQKFNATLKQLKTGDYYTDAMLDHCDSFATNVVERFNDHKVQDQNAMIVIEDELDLSKYIPEGLGTTDVTIISKKVVEVIDFKFGKGVPVYAEENKQMMLYGLGALEKYGLSFDEIEDVSMTIFQPRIDNYSNWQIPAEQLEIWAQTELIPKAQLAFTGQGEFIAGDHCLFCKAKATCRANADYQLQLARHDFAQPILLGDLDVSDLMKRRKAFIDWIDSVYEYALDQAINHGKKWPGFKVVEGRSNRKYIDEEKVVKQLKKKGFDPELFFTKKLFGITAMEAELGKAEFNTIFSDLVIKPQGAPTLVPLVDKRPEFNSTENAKKDFI